MTLTRAGMIGILWSVVGSSVLCAADFSTYRTYRGLEFGMKLSAAAKVTGSTPGDLRLVHQRPELIQEMTWRVWSTDPTDPVRSGLLYFLNGELSRIVVTYDSRRIEGMTVNDMIAGIAKVYGPATRPEATIIAYNTVYGSTAEVIARWEDADYSYNLVRTADRLSYAMILYSKRLDTLAQAASVEAVRLDKEEAPQRVLAEQAKRDEAERLKMKEARSVNQPNFRP